MSSRREDELPPAYAAIPADDLTATGNSSHPVSTLEQQQLDGPGGADDIPPPQYSEVYGEVNVQQDGMGTKASLTNDGRINININQRGARLSSLLAPALRQQWRAMEEKPGAKPTPDVAAVPEFARDVPPMNIVIQIIGSRGDVQPFLALGQVLHKQYGHRVRIATHPTFKKFVEENGLEFFSLGGDPSELMAFMVKNPGLMPGMDSLKTGVVAKRRKGMWEMLVGGWRACIEPGDGMSYTPAMNSDGTFQQGAKPFVADAIIANPPSFGHIHCAEKLGIPLHLMFTMPWSPTQAFPHPLANIQSTNADHGVTNFLSYALVEMMTWQGLGDLVNRLREKTLGLDPISTMWAPGIISRLKVPYTYCWSPALIPKPQDWPSQINISGFYFLSLASSYTPPPELAEFLAAGPPPVYIGFGSIVVDDPNALTDMILTAVRLSGARALVSKGWGGLGGDELTLPDGAMLLGNCPHDWLFPRCAAVVHHGGAGTTAAGISAGKPTVVVPFFGDQPFWGAMIARAGAGPEPVPYSKLTAEVLAENIKHSLSPQMKARAEELGNSIRHESGAENGAKSFHNALASDPAGVSRCDLLHDRVAVWKVRGSDIKLSALAATILVNKGAINGGYDDLKLYRHKDWQTDEGAWEPISGATGALVGTIGSVMLGVGDIPRETFKMFSKKKPGEVSGGDDNKSDMDKGKGKEVLRDEKDGLSTTSLQSVGPSGASSTSTSKHKKNASPPPAHDEMGTSEKINAAMQGTKQIVGAGMKSPMDLTMGLAQGFRNAPRLYGDTTVRPQERVTGFGSGLRIASKEFGLGMFDGITGLVTQPVKAVKEEGAAGFWKGVGKGVGGMVLKPGAAIWSIPGYTMKGIHQEWRKLVSPNVSGYVESARIAQGDFERQNFSEGMQKDLVKEWYALRSSGKGKAGRRGKLGGKGKERTRLANAPPSEFEHAIRESVAATSVGNVGEDAAVERAIRASVAELQRPGTHGSDEDEDEALERAIQASIAEYSGALGGAERTHTDAGHGRNDGAANDAQFDSELEEAMRQSMYLKDSATPTSRPDLPPRNSIPLSHRTGCAEDENDEDMRRAIRESLKPHSQQHQQEVEDLDPPHHHITMVDASGTPGPSNGTPDTWSDDGHTEGHGEAQWKAEEEGEEVKRALEESVEARQARDEDEEVQRAMQESVRAQEEDERRRREEEEIVLRHVLRQSIEEEEMRRRQRETHGEEQA